MDLRTNSINLLIGFYNQGRESLLRSMDWVFKSDRHSFVRKGLIFLVPRGGEVEIKKQREKGEE